MKSILTKIYFHPLFLITSLLCILIGHFRLITYFMLTILVHELGHILTALIFKWNIDKIIILPFGCITRFNEIINKPMLEELLIAISGIILQLIFYFGSRNIINYEYFSAINFFVLVFNIIPIYPLDGSKILNIIFNILTSYRKSLFLTCMISYGLIITLFIISFKINKIVILSLLFLFIEVNKLYTRRKDLFNKFLLERYLYNLEFKHRKIISNLFDMKRDYKHLFLIDNKYVTEKSFLKKMFDINSIL